MQAKSHPRGWTAEANWPRVIKWLLVIMVAYVLIAHDALEELGCSQHLGCVSVLYRKMALLGDVVAPVVYRHEGGWDVDLTDGEGATYALVRFDARQEEA